MTLHRQWGRGRLLSIALSTAWPSIRSRTGHSLRTKRFAVGAWTSPQRPQASRHSLPISIRHLQARRMTMGCLITRIVCATAGDVIPPTTGHQSQPRRRSSPSQLHYSWTARCMSTRTTGSGALRRSAGSTLDSGTTRTPRVICAMTNGIWNGGADSSRFSTATADQ